MKSHHLVTLCLPTLVSVLSLSATAGTLPCNAQGMVSRGTAIYDYGSGTFWDNGYFWLGNYYARIMKTMVGSTIDNQGNILETNVQFDLVSESDSDGCDNDIQWIRDSDFVRLP